MSNHYIVYFEIYMMLYVNYILIQLGKKECKFQEDRDPCLAAVLLTT